MKKYFYSDGVNKIGPFSLEELKEQNLTRETKVWFYGLDNWTTLSEIEELKSVTESIPPPLKKTTLTSVKTTDSINQGNIKDGNKTKNKTRTKGRNIIVVLLVIIPLLLLIIVFSESDSQDDILYQDIVASSYETDVDFDFYVDKFYRDINVFGIFPKVPKIKIIKFARFDQMDDVTHIHAISLGMNDDERIEIYINPSTWEQFSKPLRYYLMYHELSHDVLNVDDLDATPLNEGKLMYPIITSYESKTMDEFIESSHALFEEVALGY